MQNNFDFGLNIFRLHVLKVYTLKKISHFFFFWIFLNSNLVAYTFILITHSKRRSRNEHVFFYYLKSLLHVTKNNQI